MNNDSFVQEKAFAETVRAVSNPLTVIALMQLADEFYTKEERQTLYLKYAELRETDRQRCTALEELRKLLPEPGLGYEERVKQYGKEVADEHVAPLMGAMNARGDSIKAVDAFRREHKILVELLNAKDIRWAVREAK